MTSRLRDTAPEGQTCYIYVAVTDSGETDAGLHAGGRRLTTGLTAGPGLKKEDLLLLFRRSVVLWSLGASGSYQLDVSQIFASKQCPDQSIRRKRSRPFCEPIICSRTKRDAF